MSKRSELHAMIDELPEQDISELHETLRLRGFHGATAPVQDPLEGVTDEVRRRFHKELEEGRRQHARGESLPAADVVRRLKSL